MRPVYKRTLWSLTLAFQGIRPRKGPSGEELPNSRRQRANKLQGRFAVVLFKGDWDWHLTQWQMAASWKSPTRICHLCVATKVSKHGHGFCDFGANFQRRTVADFLSLLHQPLACDLVHVPGFNHQMIRFCAMHALALGVYQSLAADTLLWMCQHNAFGTSSADLDVQLQHAFEAFKLWMKRFEISEFQNDMENMGQLLTLEQSVQLDRRGEIEVAIDSLIEPLRPAWSALLMSQSLGTKRSSKWAHNLLARVLV
ncbi:unnamed protein product [Symbiodinium sp. CCMP2592]|nr:unnamed protein product [Symbiodinium sp. CCMP2592]